MKHWRKELKRIAAVALAVMMVGTTVDISALTVLAAEEMTEVTCNHVCDEACGGTEAVTGSAITGCTHIHDEECGYEEEKEDAICTCETEDPAFHATNCPAYIAPENPQCYCAEKCTEDTLNIWCDVCGVQGVSACQGTDTAVAYAAPEPYDGVPVTPQKITSSNYRTFGLTESNWEQYNGYYAIRNAKELYGFAEIINDYNLAKYTKAVLLSDIVVNETVSESGATYSWTPIGGDVYFSGEFDGNGHSISGLYCNTPDESNVGLFGHTGVAIIRNVTLENSYLCGNTIVGGIVGRLSSATLTNCKVDSDVTIVATSSDEAVNVGGMFGKADIVSIQHGMCNFTNCTSLATVKAPNVPKRSSGYYEASMGAFCGYADYEYCEQTAGTNCFYVPNSVTGADGTSDRGAGLDDVINERLATITIDNNGEITDTHTHVSATHSRIEPTCYSTGLTEYSYCIICGEILSGTNEEIPTVDHEYSDATCKVPKTCVYCGVTTGETIDHIYSDATCTTPPTCNMCGLKNGSVNPDNHTTDETQLGIVSSNRRYHAYVYKCCGAVQSNEELHKDFMENGVCSKCSYVCEHLSITDGKCDDCGIEGDTAYVNRYWDAVNKIVITNDYALVGNVTEITSSTTALSEGWYIVKGEVTNSNRLTVSGTVNLILADGCTLNVANGICVPEGTTLNIYGQIQGTGKLVASNESEADNAAIGGNQKENAGSIVINGGVVEATSGIGSTGAGAAIGGGYNVRATDVEINGGVVKASGTYRYSATIGMGDYGVNGAHSVTIHGGTITASATQYAIGSGHPDNNYCTVTVDGGNISGTVCGKTLTNTSGTSVSCVEITLNGATDGMVVTELEGITYGLTDVKTIGDKLYIYLPDDTMPTSVTAGGNTYICNVDGTFYQEHNWVDATCFSPKHCSRCEITEGEASSHNYENGVCTYCGMDENGVFHITTANQLVAFAQYVELGNKDADAVLDADVDMTNVDWTPICQTVSFHDTVATDTGYTGTFDGNGHTISYLTVTGISGGTYSYGLFGTVSGTVENLGMVNYTYTMGSATDARAGSIAGQVLTGGTITNCYSVGHTVTTNSNIAGGIAGCNYGGTISNCYALNGSVSGYASGDYIRWGGVVGDSKKDDGASDQAQTYGTVSYCYTDDTQVVSSQNDSGSIINCAVKGDTAFESGEITYLLNGSSSENVTWYQILGTDTHPVLDKERRERGTVYSVLKCDEETQVYRNVNENEPHTDNNSDGMCDVCGGNAHTHEWTYTANDDTITAECGAADCPLNGAAKTIVISALDKTYDGTAVVATVENNVDTTDYSSSIVYRDSRGAEVNEAVNAGRYTANLTVGGKTAKVEFTISPKPITVKADNTSKTYGENDTTLTYNVPSGLVIGETLIGALTREPGENVGTYAITQGTLTNPNYDITFVEGTFTINKATPVSLETPEATAITYGDALSSSVLDDSSWAWLNGTIVPDAYTDCIAYIEVDDINYDYTGVNGYDSSNHRVVRDIVVIINRATLTITAKSYTIKVGEVLPTYEYIVTGLVDGDTLPVDVSLSCSATDNNAVGTYTITISGEVSDNILASHYVINFVNGTLNVCNKETQTITAYDIILTYGETENIGATTSGNGDITYSTTSDVISVAADGTITVLKAGTATVTINAAETADYAAAAKTISVTVNKAENAPNMPGTSMNVPYSTKTVSEVTLPTGWVWQDADKNTSLEVGVVTNATAVYTGADKGNYENESVMVAITRSDCEHTNTEVRGVKAATCKEIGYTGDTYCKSCEALLSGGQTISATGHDYSSTVTKEATTTSEGVRTYTCDNCGDSYTESIPKLPMQDPEPEPTQEELDEAHRKMIERFYWNGNPGWKMVNGEWYMFDEFGSLRLGWIQTADGKWYYMNNDGTMATGWTQSPASMLWYYMDLKDGYMLSDGWLCDPESNRWYYLDPNGAMCTGWLLLENGWYLFDENGAMCTGWNFVKGHWYLLGSDGLMRTGWQTVSGKEYYMVETGECLLNTTTPDGHKVDEDGAKIK